MVKRIRKSAFVLYLIGLTAWLIWNVYLLVMFASDKVSGNAMAVFIASIFNFFGLIYSIIATSYNILFLVIVFLNRKSKMGDWYSIIIFVLACLGLLSQILFFTFYTIPFMILLLIASILQITYKEPRVAAAPPYGAPQWSYNPYAPNQYYWPPSQNPYQGPYAQQSDPVRNLFLPPQKQDVPPQYGNPPGNNYQAPYPWLPDNPYEPPRDKE